MVNKNSVRIGIIIVLVIIAGAIFIGFMKEEKSYEIKDRCGPVMNFVSHTIQDESACRLQCRSRCDTNDLKYDRVIFEEKEAGCNSCMCYCKKGILW